MCDHRGTAPGSVQNSQMCLWGSHSSNHGGVPLGGPTTANHNKRDMVQRLDLFVKSLLKGNEMKTQEG